MKKNTKQTKDDKMKKPKQHPKPKGFRMGLRAKILGISLPITIIMVIANDRHCLQCFGERHHEIFTELAANISKRSRKSDRGVVES